LSCMNNDLIKEFIQPDHSARQADDLGSGPDEGHDFKFAHG
jgi:hypothetical protein